MSRYIFSDIKGTIDENNILDILPDKSYEQILHTRAVSKKSLHTLTRNALQRDKSFKTIYSHSSVSKTPGRTRGSVSQIPKNVNLPKLNNRSRFGSNVPSSVNKSTTIGGSNVIVDTNQTNEDYSDQTSTPAIMDKQM